MSANSAQAPATRHLDAAAIAVVTLLCMSWGINQVAVKLALPEIPPLMQSAFRSAGALLMVVIVARIRGSELFKSDGTLIPGVIAGVLFGIEFIMIYRGLLYTTASRAVVFLYTAPFFVALGARFWLGETMSRVQWAGLAMSFAGVALAIGVPQASVTTTTLLGDVMLIGGGAAWAATTLIIKSTRLVLVPPEKSMAYQLAVSAVILTLASVFYAERLTAVPSVAAMGWLAYQTFWVVGITYTIWFGLVRIYSTNRLSSFTFMTPLFGVAAGYIFLNEPLSMVFIVAAILVLGGLILVNKPR
jgi:drug/metabolite transporter (DMT)-like permease